LDTLLTVEELAARLKVKIGTVRSWVYKRVIPFTRFGHRIYFPLGVVESILARNLVQPARASQVQVPVGQGGAEHRRAEK
jgi:excisionase family DNA binding protein